ncbi:MAG: hypothetical protein ACI9OJ_004718, partial [Myxococcota bacterium]
MFVAAVVSLLLSAPPAIPVNPAKTDGKPRSYSLGN